jgi:hypothetical protein
LTYDFKSYYDPAVTAGRLAALALVAVGAGMGQKMLSARAGLVYFVVGRVSIAGSRWLAAGAVKRQLNEGETLFSEAGRAEVLLNPGAVLRIGEMTRVRMDRVELADPQVSIETGSAVVTVFQLPKLNRVEIRVGGGVVVIKGEGVYRFDADAARLRVFGGQAEAYRLSPDTAAWKTVAKRGQTVRLADLQVGKFDLKDADALEQWAEKRGAPPPLIPMAPMVCYSEPKNSAEMNVWMRDCYKR